MNNPPAFPVLIVDRPKELLQYNGMTLRDYFAAKAMAAMINRADARFTTTLEVVGGMSYQYADAMLKAREA